MKKLGLILGIIFAFQTVSANSQEAVYRKVENKSFKAGEKLRYRMHYGLIDAGEAVLEVQSTDKKVNGRSLLHVVGTGRTLGSFDWFFKVRDRYESYLDSKSMFPWLFIRRVNEGGFKINQNYTFHQDKKYVDNGEGEKFDTPNFIQDMLSSFYYARTIDYSNAKEGQTFNVEMFIDNEVFPLKLKFLGRETIKTRKGKFKCLKFCPVVMEGRIWKNEEDMILWITDDENKIPVLAKTKIAVGSIKATLVEWEGLANNLTSKL